MPLGAFFCALKAGLTDKPYKVALQALELKPQGEFCCCGRCFDYKKLRLDRAALHTPQSGEKFSIILFDSKLKCKKITRLTVRCFVITCLLNSQVGASCQLYCSQLPHTSRCTREVCKPLPKIKLPIRKV